MEYKTVYIADLRSNNNAGKSTGHFLPVAAMYQKLFAGKCNVKVAGGPVYLTRFRSDEMCLLPYDVSSTSIRDKWHTMKNAIKLFGEAKGQTIVVQQGTVVTAMIAIALFYRNTSRLYMIQYSDEGVRTVFRRLIYRFAKRKIDGIICPNRIVGEAYERPYLVVPDYIYTGEHIQQSVKAYNDKTYDFCMIGRISPEKGVVNVARLLRNTKYKVLIAGKTQNEDQAKTLHEICDDSLNIVLRLEYVSDTDYLNYLNDSRYAILNYSGEYSKRSSGVVYDTIFNGVPVIGCRCSALQFIENMGLGMLFDDIMQFNPEMVLDEAFHKKCLNDIAKYKKSHDQYKKELLEFVM